jgi:hypothetical protein
MEDVTLPQLVFFGIIGAGLWLVLLRWALGVDTKIKHQKAMIAFLIKLCRQQGVSEDEIDGLKNTFGLK